MNFTNADEQSPPTSQPQQQQQHHDEEDDDQDNPRKRKRGPYKRNGILTDLYEHFTTLDEKRTSSVGKQSCHFLCLCNYCQHHYLDALQLYNRRKKQCTFDSSPPPPPPQPPKKLTRCTRDCEGHLRKCNAYRTFCQENNIVPYGEVNYEKKHIEDVRLPPSVAGQEAAAAVVATKRSSSGTGAAAAAVAAKVASVSLKAAPKVARPAPLAPTGATTIAPPVAAAAPAPLRVKKEAKVSGSKSKTIIPHIPKLPHVDPRFEPLLVEFLVDNDLPLQTVERPSFARLMEAVTASCGGGTGFQLNFGQLIPSCTKLRDVALASAGTSLAAMQANLGIEFNRGHAPAMIVKTRMVPIITASSTILSQHEQQQELSLPPQGMRLVHVIDSVLLKAGNTTLTLDIYEDHSMMSCLFKQQDGMTIARVWENMLLNKDHHHCTTAAAITATSTAAAAASTPIGETPAFVANDEEYFRYFLSEDIGNCARARNILALRHPSMLWLRCWVHQLHEMVQKLLHAAVLKQQTFQFHKVCTHAITAALTIQASSTTTPVTGKGKSNATAAMSLALQLQATVDDMYEANTWTGISTVNASDGWSCMQACFASQLCIRDACVSLARDLSSVPHEIKKQDDFDNMNESPPPLAPKRAAFPMALNVWKDTEYWEELQHAESLIRPFCEASCLLQAPQANTLAHVVFMLLSLYSKLQSYCAFLGEDEGAAGGGGGGEDGGDDTPVPSQNTIATRRAAWRQMAEILIRDIEERWEKEDNPLFFLAFALHPSFRNVAVDIVKKSGERDGSWNSDKNPLSVSRLVSAAKFYYEKHKLHQSSSVSSSSASRSKAADCTKHELGLLGKRIHQWLIGREFAGVSPFIPQQENAVAWWEENKFEYPEIARLAIFLLDAPIRASADCNTLFQQQSQDTFPPPPSSPIGQEGQQEQHQHHDQQQYLLKKEHPKTFYMRQIIRGEMKCRYGSDGSSSAVAAASGGNKSIPTAAAATTTNPSRQRAIIDATPFKLLKKEQKEAKDTIMEQGLSPPTPPPKDAGDTASSNIGPEHNDTSEEHSNHVSAADDEDTGETEIEYWLRILESVRPNRDSDDDNLIATNDEVEQHDGNAKKKSSIDMEDDLMESDNEEDLPETSTSTKLLPPLPKHDDDKSYPHEGPQYFASKNYVRKDKYTLAKLLQGGNVELPSLSSIYGAPSS